MIIGLIFIFFLTIYLGMVCYSLGNSILEGKIKWRWYDYLLGITFIGTIGTFITIGFLSEIGGS